MAGGAVEDELVAEAGTSTGAFSAAVFGSSRGICSVLCDKSWAPRSFLGDFGGAYTVLRDPGTDELACEEEGGGMGFGFEGSAMS